MRPTTDLHQRLTAQVDRLGDEAVWWAVLAPIEAEYGPYEPDCDDGDVDDYFEDLTDAQKLAVLADLEARPAP